MSKTPQRPIGSGFGYRSTAKEVVDGIDLSGKLAIVTGGYSGLGIETVKALVGAGASVVVPARRVEHARRSSPASSASTSTSSTSADQDSVKASPSATSTPAERSIC